MSKLWEGIKALLLLPWLLAGRGKAESAVSRFMDRVESVEGCIQELGRGLLKVDAEAVWPSVDEGRPNDKAAT